MTPMCRSPMWAGRSGRRSLHRTARRCNRPAAMRYHRSMDEGPPVNRRAHTPRGAWTRWSVDVRERFAAQPLCIALANTRNWRHAEVPLERLNSYADVIELARRERLVDEAGVQR